MTPARRRALLRLAAALLGVNVVLIALSPQDDLYAWAPALFVGALLLMFGPPVLRRMRRDGAPRRVGAERRQAFVLGRTAVAAFQGAFVVALVAAEVLSITHHPMPWPPESVWAVSDGSGAVLGVSLLRGGPLLQDFEGEFSGRFVSSTWTTPPSVRMAGELIVRGPPHPLQSLRDRLDLWRLRSWRSLTRDEPFGPHPDPAVEGRLWSRWRD